MPSSQQFAESILKCETCVRQCDSSMRQVLEVSVHEQTIQLYKDRAKTLNVILETFFSRFAIVVLHKIYIYIGTI